MAATSETDPAVIGMRQAVNAGMTPNYSPTAFMVHTLLPANATVRAMDYIGTIYYGGPIKNRNGQTVDSYRALRNIRVQ
jgi:hypothetical protein